MHYCGSDWSGEWSCPCDDDCPHCGARHMSPHESDDLTEIFDEQDGRFVALRSRDYAENSPDYVEVAVLCEVPEPHVPQQNVKFAFPYGYCSGALPTLLRTFGYLTPRSFAFCPISSTRNSQLSS